jgi:two-component system sensor histidine kinase HydH
MGEMAAGIAHEINNPLTTMKNLVHTMRGAHPADDVGDQDLSIIAEEIEKINRLVVNFLRYARPPKAKKKSLAPREVVEKTLDLLEPQIKQKRINIKRNLGQDAQRIFVDQEQLGQVYLNLLLNAIQASPEGAEIEVFVRSVFADSSDVPTRVELGVTDHGCGIRMEDRSRVFLPFFTTKSQGSGLGLAISQRIIEDHGGELSFTSRPDEETTFLISLSLQEERDEPAADR